MMEKENFDEEFKNRIKQVFEEYDDSTASEGWNLLREKYPAKKRRDGFVWWIFAAVALVLIALIFGLFQADFYQKNASKIVKQHQIDTVSVLPNHYSSTQKSGLTQVSADRTNTKKTSIKTASHSVDKRLSKTNNFAQNKISADALNPQKTPVKTASGFVSKQTTINNNQTGLTINQQKIQPEIAIENQNNASFIDIKTDSVKIKNQQKFTLASKDSSGQKLLTTIAKTTNPTFAKPAVKKYTEAEISKKATEKPAIFSLEVYAGSHVNYAAGSNNQLGLGAGFSTAFRLSKSFKLATGLGLMQNNLAYKQDIPTGSLNAASSSYSTIVAGGIGSATGVQNPGLNSLGTHLLALDVPVNLVYTFSPGKNSISVSAGISSNTFVKETYDYHYSNSTNTTQNIKSFNNFNLAKTLNLAAGFAYPLGKSKLQVEPFLKYPLGGLGSQQLQFGAAGINLKMNIQSFKK